MTDRPVALELHGVSLSLTSQLPAFSDYVRTAMEPFLIEDDGYCEIRSHLDWVDGLPSPDLATAFPGATFDRRPDRSVYLGEGCAHWLKIDAFNDLQMSIAIDDEAMRVVGRYHFHLSGSRRMERLQRIRFRSRMERLQARRFSTLLYFLVYHPILWSLSRSAGWNVLHGGAVATPRGAIVLAGMPGCGKSTLASSMLCDPQRSLLSDNLLLYGGGNVVACPELMLLDEGSLARAGEGAKRLVSTGEQRLYARDAYRPDAYYLDPIAPAAIFMVERGHETVIEPLTIEECVRRMLAGNTMAREVRRIQVMHEVLDAMAGTSAADPAGELATLVGDVPRGVLRVGEGHDLADVVSRHLIPYMDGRATRGVG